MLILNGRIDIVKADGTTYTIDRPGDIRIESTYVNMTDIATVTIPNRFKVKDKIITAQDNNYTISSGENRLFAVGDYIEIRLSYVGQHDLNDDNARVFMGFIREINNDSPIKMVCDNYMYLLKKTRSNISLPKGSTISQVINELLVRGGWEKDPDFNGVPQYRKVVGGRSRTIGVVYTDPNTEFGELLVQGSPSMASVLDTLHTFTFFFRENNLYVALPQTQTFSQRKNHKIVYEDQVIQDDLFYQVDEDVLYKVVAKSLFVDETDSKGNKYIEVEVGDPDGEVRTLYAPKRVSEKELKLMAEEKLRELKYTGFKASFVTFGFPIMRHLDTVEISRKKLKQQGIGKFLIDKVITEFGQGGFRQEVYLGSKA